MAKATIDRVEVAEDVRLAVARLQRAIRYNDSEGLSPTMGATLGTIERMGPLTLGELAENERMAKPTVTNIIEKLEAKKLIKRKQDKADKRITNVEITKTGIKFIAKSRARRTAWLAEKLDDLNATQIRQLAKAAQILDQLARTKSGSN